MIKPSVLEFCRKHLQAMRTRLDDRTPQLRDEATQSTGGESAGGLSDIPLHPADLGSQESEKVVSIALAENEAFLRLEVDEALFRLENGSFGICEECHKEIAPERLEAVPYSRWCIECARKSQAEQTT